MRTGRHSVYFGHLLMGLQFTLLFEAAEMYNSPRLAERCVEFALEQLASIYTSSVWETVPASMVSGSSLAYLRTVTWSVALEQRGL